MGNLDPTAEEFWPRNHTHGAHHPPPQPHSHLCPTSSPTRSLMLGLVPSATTAVTEAWLMRELGAFGDVRGLRMEGFGHGMVIAIVHFYDLRHAEAAFTAILGHHQQYYGFVLWVQYMVPSSCDDGHNQGTLLLFNLDSHMDDISITNIFQPFGAVKEVRHAPLKKNQRFVEFFDIRDAAMAFKHMNGNQIHGKPLVIQFGPPSVGGGHYRKFKPPRALGSLQQHKFWPPFSRDVTKGSCYDDKTHSEELLGIMGSMNLGDDEEFGNNGGKEAERNSPPKCDDESIVGDTKQLLEQQTARSRRHRKGKHANLKKHHHHYETRRYLINQHVTHDKDSSSGSFIDSRTTVMIKNIPNKYSQKLLLSMLDNHCNQCNEQIREGGHDHEPLSSYDFLYLPIDFNNKCNVGYGFVNMTSPEATMRLYKAFHGQQWQVFNSRKICEITYARVQGLEALKEHFKKSKLGYDMEHYLPVVLSPPRDGRQLTEPLAIVGHAHHHIHNKHQSNIATTAPPSHVSSTSSSSSSSSSQSDGVERQS